MNIQDAALNLLLAKSLESQAKPDGGANEKTIQGEVKSVSQNPPALLISLSNNTSILLEIPQGTALEKQSFSVGDKIEIPLSVIKNAILLNSLQENQSIASIDKFASQSQTQTQMPIDKAAEFAKIAENALKSLGAETAAATKTFDEKEAEFTKAFLKEVEQIIKRTTTQTTLTQMFPKAATVKNADEILTWATTQIKNGNLPVKDFFALPQILLPSVLPAQSTISAEIPINLPQQQPTPQQPVLQQTALTPQQPIPQQIPPQTSQQNPQPLPLPNPAANLSAANLITTNSPQAFFLPKENASVVTALPQEVRFVQQTTVNFRENIQNLIPQFQNESIKNLLNEMVKQISTNIANMENTFAFVKIDTKNQSANFMPLSLQTQFNSEFVAIMSKNFPNLSKELFIETANIIKNSEKPLILSENTLKNVEIILKTLTAPSEKPQTPEIQTQQSQPQAQAAQPQAQAAQPQTQIQAQPQVQEQPQQTQPQAQTPLQTQAQAPTPPIILQTETAPPPLPPTPTPPQWKITPSMLAIVLNYAADTEALSPHTPKNEAVLQNFKTLFASEKTIDNLIDEVKSFIRVFAGIEKEIAEKTQTQTQPQTQIQNEKNTILQNDKQPLIQTEKPLPITMELSKSLEKLTDFQNIFKNAEMIFKKESPIEFLLSRIGFLQNKFDTESAWSRAITSPLFSSKIDENLRGVLREMSEHIKTTSIKLQNLPNSTTDEKLTSVFSRLRDLANSVNDAARRIDGSTLLANRGELAAGRSEQTVLIPVQIGNAWIQMELRVNKDGKGKGGKYKKEASQVEVSVELEKGNSVSAKANLTLEKQLQVSINFTNEKMLEWFKINFNEFCESLKSAGTKSVQVVFNREKNSEKREIVEIRKSNFELVG